MSRLHIALLLLAGLLVVWVVSTIFTPCQDVKIPEQFTSSREKAQRALEYFGRGEPKYVDYRDHMLGQSNIYEYYELARLHQAGQLDLESAAKHLR